MLSTPPMVEDSVCTLVLFATPAIAVHAKVRLWPRPVPGLSFGGPLIGEIVAVHGDSYDVRCAIVTPGCLYVFTFGSCNLAGTNGTRRGEPGTFEVAA